MRAMLLYLALAVLAVIGGLLVVIVSEGGLSL